LLGLTHIRCSSCRAVLPLAVIWASGDICPRCAADLSRDARAAPPQSTPGNSPALATDAGEGLPPSNLPPRP
jgi:predicted amidophosphoribosyltransferase